LPSARFTANADVSPTGLRAGLPGDLGDQVPHQGHGHLHHAGSGHLPAAHGAGVDQGGHTGVHVPCQGGAQHHQHTDLGVGEYHQGQLDGSGECCVLGAACVAGGVSGGGQYQPGDGVSWSVTKQT
jgi:hypothetical protein